MLTLIKIVLIGLLLIIPVLLVLVVYKMFMNQNREKIINILKNKVDRGMHDSKIDFFNYERIRLYLSRNGVDYMFKSKVQPMIYLSIRFGFMIIAFVGLSYNDGLFWGTIGGMLYDSLDNRSSISFAISTVKQN